MRPTRRARRTSYRKDNKENFIDGVTHIPSFLHDKSYSHHHHRRRHHCNTRSGVVAAVYKVDNTFQVIIIVLVKWVFHMVEVEVCFVVEYFEDRGEFVLSSEKLNVFQRRTPTIFTSCCTNTKPSRSSKYVLM